MGKIIVAVFILVYRKPFNEQKSRNNGYGAYIHLVLNRVKFKTGMLLISNDSIYLPHAIWTEQSR